MKKWLLHIMLISVLGILAASCSQIIDDPISGECEMDTEKVQITFTLSMKAVAPDSRTWGTDYNPNNIGNEFENRIDLDNLQVLVFNETTCVGEVNILAYWKVAENIYEFRGELPEATISTTTDYKVMVFANCPDVDGNTGLANPSFVFHGDDADTEYIPMWGVKTTKFTLERFQDLGQIKVLRAMAKVEVKLGDALEGYNLEKVQLNADKYNVGGFCLPIGYDEAANTEDMGLEEVFNPKNSGTTTPSGTVALEFEKIANTHYIYIPEYLTTLEADKPSMTVTLKAPNSVTKTYPLEFKYYSGENVDIPFDIVRNHWYQYTITGVNTGLSANLEVTANEWDLQEVSVNYKAEPATDGTITWDTNVLQNGEVKLGGDAMSTDISFKLVGPTDGTWTATLIRTEGLPGAFSFNASQVVEQVSGNVGETATLTIHAMNETVTENCKAKLQIVVKTQDGTRTIDVTEMLNANHLIVQSK